MWLSVCASVAGSVKLIVPRMYQPQAGVPVRVEVWNDYGQRDWNLWDAEAFLTSDNPAVTLSTNRIVLRNGLGSALLRITGTANFTLTATINGMADSKSVQAWITPPSITYTGGTLVDELVEWRGLVLVTNDVTVPAGSRLVIEPDTMVLMSGVASGTVAPDIIIQGEIFSLGTESQPVTITCSNISQNWGQIRHNNAQPSLYQYTMITKGGRATGEGHTTSGPMIRPTNSRLTFESCVISDATANGMTTGKVMQATSSDLVFNDCILARAKMGPEVTTTSVLCTNTWITEMTGPDDADGIYLHDAPGRQLWLTRCVIASGTDDAVDLLNAVVDIDDCIVRDWPNPSEDAKGISAFHGVTRISRSLFHNCYVGVAAKSGGPSALVTLNNCTITGIQRAVSAAFKANATVGNIDFRLTNCIVRSADAIHSDFSPTNFHTITYCNLSEPWAGAGNITSNPLFVNATSGDYHLQPFSPCIDTGHPASPPDPDGSPADMGYFRFIAPQPTLNNLQRLGDGTVQFAIQAYTNRNYVIEFSSDFTSWNELLTSWQSSETMQLSDSPPSGTASRHYRAKLAP